MKDLLKWVVYNAIFAVPFVLLIVSESLFFPYITGKNFTFRILVEIGFAAWLLLALYDRVYRPRFSLILVAIASLVGIMFFANLFGEYAPKSFWGNYERMEGWITLLHFFLYFLMLGTMLHTEKLWNRFWNVALVAAGIMSFYALGQIGGLIEISQGSAWRVDARLGNSSYLGVYMLFQMFVAAWLFIRTKGVGLRGLYGGLFFLFAFILFHTGTRGTMLGLIGGSGLAFVYLALMAERGAAIKKWALGGFLAVLVVVGGLFVAKDHSFVKEHPILSRLTNISLAEGSIRFTVWGVALEGVKEHPVLGWGQENFNYVFNKYFDPALYAAEPWYDRTHNIFLDWLITGGVIGLFAYLYILSVALYYSVFRPLWNRIKAGVSNTGIFKVEEQALILGLLAGYMFHNLFVFDNLASWIFYAAVLALIHQRVSRPVTFVENYRINSDILERIVIPATVVIASVTIYFVNVPSIRAAGDIIDAYREQTLDGKIAKFETALSRGSFADQEISEQFAQAMGTVVSNPSLAADKKLELIGAVNSALTKLENKKPGDARVYLVHSNFYRMAGEQSLALAELNRSLELAPQKSDILEEQGLMYVIVGDKEAAVETLRHAYELDKRNGTARVRLAAALLNNGQTEEVDALLDPAVATPWSDLWYALAADSMIISIAHQEKRQDILLRIMVARKEIEPTRIDYRTNLAAVYYETGELDKAIAVLEEAIRDIPTFKSEGQALIKKIKSEQ